MTELMIFAWYIGLLFTWGITLGLAVDNLKGAPWIAFVAIVFWPLVMGVYIYAMVTGDDEVDE